MKKTYILKYLAPCLLASCTDSLSDLPPMPSTLVVEGWIEEGGYPVVMLSTTVPVSEDRQEISTLADHVRRWARVTVSDGENEVVLTGVPDERYFPPYKYTTTSIKGREGATYTLTVNDGDLHATAVTTIPPAVDLDSLTVEDVEDKNGMRMVFAHFREPQGQKNRYCLFYKCGTETQQFTLSGMGVFDDTSVEGEVAYPVYKTDNVRTQYRGETMFWPGEQVCVKLATLDEQSYTFWYDYQNVSDLSGNFFMPYTQNVRSNIIGGKGYWCGYGTSEKWIEIK